MRQLTGIDNSFLQMETPTTFGHVAGLNIYDPTNVQGGDLYAAIRRIFAERLHLVPPLRWRLVEVPLGLGFPYWIEEARCDLDFHLRHIAVPTPGTQQQLADLIARLHAHPLDRSRPLWEAYVIDGLEDGNVAFYWKQHHAAVDGVSTTTINNVMFDTTPQGRLVEPEVPQEPEEVPTQIELLAMGAQQFAAQPWRAAQWAYRVARALPFGDLLPSVRDVRRSVFGPREGETVEPLSSFSAPRLPFNAPISAQRRFALGTVSLADVKLVKNRYGTTLNDVVMAMSSAALRKWLIDRDSLPQEPLHAGVPISIRTPQEADAYGNRVSMMVAELGAHLENPVDRLLFCRDQMRIAKEKFGALPAEEIAGAANLIPPVIASFASRVAFRTRITDYVTLPFNVVISNVPGPRDTIYASGAEMVSWLPVSAVADGAGLNMTVVSYRDSLSYGFLACRELVPDVGKIGRNFELALEELKDCALAQAA